MNILAVITARGGSKGLPDKHLLDLGGRPVLDWTFSAAKGVQHQIHAILSTDSERIAALGRDAKISVPFLRPAALAADDAKHIDVVEHAASWCRRHQNFVADVLLLLQPTSPFRTSADIDQAIDLLMESDSPGVVSVCPSAKHPFYSFYRSPTGQLERFIPAAKERYERRQNFPPAYDENGAIYLIRAEALWRERCFSPPGVLGYVMPPERSVDIDTEADLNYARYLLHVNKKEARL